MSENAVTIEAKGLNTQPNELKVPEGSLVVAENVDITRDNVVQVATGFEDYSTNLPDFTPAQLFAFGGTAYLHLDNGIWYDNAGTWTRKRGSFQSMSIPLRWGVVLSGHLYLTGYYVIWDINLSTGRISALAGRPNATGSSDGTGDAARFGVNLGGICTDGTSLYVADSGNSIVRKVTTAGVVTTLAGTAGATGTTDANGSSARFSSTLMGICTDNTFLYLCDAGNSLIRRVQIASPNAVITVCGTAAAFFGQDGTGANGKFSAMKGICTDGSFLYVADGEGVRRIAPPFTASAGVVTTIAGLLGSSGASDGTGTAARFTTAYGIAFDGSSLYVCDQGNQAIRKVSAPLTAGAGIVTTPMGTLGSSGNVDGIGSAARFSAISLLGIAWDGTSALYICDSALALIRKAYTATNYVTTVVGNNSSGGFPAQYADGIVVGPT